MTQRQQIWKNWAGTVQSRVKEFYKPHTQNQIISIIQNCIKNKQKIRVVGSGHSCSAIAVQDDAIYVSLENYNKILHIDSITKQMTVEAGILLKNLVEELTKHNLALSNMGTIAEQSLAGVLATATHGSGYHIGGYDGIVKAITMIDCYGKKHEFNENHPDFEGVKVHLGVLGAVSTITIQCEDLYNLECYTKASNLETTLTDFEIDLKNNEHYRFWWIPHTNHTQTWFANRTKKAKTLENSKLKKYWQDIIKGNILHEFCLFLTHFFPKLCPFVNKCLFHFNLKKSTYTINRYDKIFTFPILVKQNVMEFAIPFEKTREALLGLQKIINENNLYVHAPVEVRFTPASKAWLAPNYNGRMCYIGIIMYRPYGLEPRYKSYFNIVNDYFKSLNGVPHYGKYHYFTAEDFAKNFSMWHRFCDLRQYLDPENIFLNDYVAKWLKPDS